MNDRSFISRLIATGIVACLLGTLGGLIYGHCDAGGSELCLTESYITGYMKKAPHWPWLSIQS